MSIIDSSTTGHNQVQERKFSNKLFIGLGIIIVIAVVAFVIAGGRSGSSTVPTIENQHTTDSTPTPIPEQPKN